MLWIGGPAGAGKTTIARLLARRHGLRWYSGDTMTWEHRDRALAAGLEVAPRGSWEWTVRRLDETAITTITVDHLTVDETIGEVERVFAPYLAVGPTAACLKERQELIRSGNQAIVTQHARFPAGRTTIRIFDCECAASSCDAFVDLRVRDAETAIRDAPPAILAPGH